MSVKLHHAFTRWFYEQTKEGLVLVTDKEGNTGLFNPNGTWVSGKITAADNQIIGYVGGPHAQRDPSRPDPGTRFAGQAKDP